MRSSFLLCWLSCLFTSSHALRIAIVGGGIAGLATGIALKGEHEVKIFERAKAPYENGNAITIAPNAQEALKKIGIWGNIEPHVEVHPHNMFYQFLNGEEEGLPLITRVLVGKDKKFTSLHRVRLVNQLLEPFKGTNIIQYDHAVSGFESLGNGKGARIHFKNGGSYDADIVIGADGVRSVMRGYLDPKVAGEGAKSGDAGLQRTGIRVYRKMYTPDEYGEKVTEKGSKDAVTVDQNAIIGKNRHLFLYPVKEPRKQDQTEFNMVAFVRDALPKPNEVNPYKSEFSVQETKPGQVNGISKEFQNFKGFVPELVKMADTGPTNELAESIPLNTYKNGRLLLIGDAAHTGQPHLGAWAGMAMEEAAALKHVLSNPKVNGQNVETALKVFDEVRRPRSNGLLDRSREAGDVYHMRVPELDTDEKRKARLDNMFKELWDYDQNEERRKMDELLRKDLAKGQPVS